MATEIMTEFAADVFKDKLGILKGIEAVITVQEFTPPQFRKPRPVPFCIKREGGEPTTQASGR